MACERVYMAKATKTIRLPMDVATELEEYGNQSEEVEVALKDHWEWEDER